MRSLAFASLVILAAAVTVVGACSAVDNFNHFKFADDGGAGDAMTGGGLPGFGQPCTDQCQGGDALRPVMCVKSLGGKTVPGGICTRGCTVGGAVSCSDFADAACVHVEGMDVCL